MRRLLLWMARNRFLRTNLPKLWFAKRAVRRFMPGETPESALDAAVKFQAEGIRSEFTRLGENVETLLECEDTASHYIALMADIEARGIDGEVSVKLTQLGYDIDVERTLERAQRLAAKAAEGGRTFWIDMEGSAYAEGTISFYERLKSTHPNTGLCLQSYLRRTAADIERLLPLAPRIRLVKGAYSEPESIAFKSHDDVNRSFVDLAVALLEGRRQGGDVRLGLGTHDVKLIEQIAERASAMDLPKSSFEVQMLYGIRMDQQRRLVSEGYIVRALISYGHAWYPWYMRRLAERPANVIFALRQIIG
jgi:proline dehydrogenase